MIETEKILKPHQLLNKAFARKKAKNPSYSQRSLARDVGVSAVFVTKILAGQKEIPPPRIKKLVKVLEMDPTAEMLLYQSILYHALPIPEVQSMLLRGGFKPSKMANFDKNADTKFSVLKSWYNLAILDLLTCKVNHDPKAMAKVLGITLTEVERSLEGLSQDGLIEDKNGVWVKQENYDFFPTTKSRTEVRDFHRQMIKKAYEELSRSTQEDFDRRLITGFTIATNPARLEEARRFIFESLSEVTDVLTEGPCTEVYQYNVQLFPLTKK